MIRGINRQDIFEDTEDYRKLIEVLEMPFNLRKSMSLAAEKDARERFSAETNAENVYRLYEETLAGRNR